MLDTLNSTGKDQAVARQEMIGFLKHLPPGERISLFVLGTHLRMMQGFSGDSQTLIRAATALMSKTSPHLITEGEHEDNAATVDALTANLDAASAAAVRDSLERAISEEEAFKGEERMETTLNAINALTRAVGGLSGTQNFAVAFRRFPFSPGP